MQRITTYQLSSDMAEIANKQSREGKISTLGSRCFSQYQREQTERAADISATNRILYCTNSYCTKCTCHSEPMWHCYILGRCHQYERRLYLSPSLKLMHLSVPYRTVLL